MTPSSEATANLLLVDDQPANLLALEAMLGDLGRPVTALSGEEALRHLLKDDFAVVLLDVQMRGLDGFATAQLIRAREKTHHLPIIFLTAHDSPDFTPERAYTLGAVDFLVKPLVPVILRAKVAGFVELFRKAEQVRRQAERLRQLEREEFERRLALERQLWELERLRSEAARERQTAERLTEMDRRKDEFLALLAHELRNPLAPIRNAVKVLRHPGLPEAVAEEARAVIDRQVSHLARLVDDLLDVSRITHGKITLRTERVALAEVVAHAVETCRPLLDARGHSLTVNLPAEPVWVEGDPARLGQVLVNLLTNAAKYTEPPGRVELTAAREGDEAVLRVRDNGVGIPPEMLAKVFERFTQLDRTPGRAGQWGLGLGLSLVKDLVALHGGSVTAFSAGPGQGSEFVVRLPAAPPGEAGTAAAAAAEPARPRRVLLTDDNDDAARALAALLRSDGHEVRVAPDGPAALAAAAEFRPEVVLLDIGLPRMDGYEVARQLRREPATAGAVLVALTCYASEEDRRRCLAAGFDHHLVKSGDPAEVKGLLSAGRPAANGAALR